MRQTAEARVFGLGAAQTTFSPPRFEGWNALLTVAKGSIVARTPSRVFPIFEHRAAVINDAPVQIELRERADVRVVYVHYELPVAGTIVSLSRVAQAIIERAVVRGYLDPKRAADRRLLHVLRDELLECRALADIGRLSLPAPPRNIPANCGRRTLQRIFRRETGLGLATWKRRYTLMVALAKIAQGERVSHAAYDCGYATPSAFIHACRREFGATPLCLIRRLS